MGILQKTGNFLGINKLGQGIATTTRVLTGEVGQDIKRQEETTSQINKILYAVKQEKDPLKKRKLLELASSMGTTNSSAMEIDPGLNLTNKEVVGSAANVVLNVATPGAFKGGKIANIAKNTALGAGFGAASGLEKNRGTGGIVGSTVGGALVGGAVGSVALMAKGLKDFTTKTTPKWLMDKAITPALNDAKKSIKYGNKTIGEELLAEGVRGNPEKLLSIADNKLKSLEDDLQKVISHPSLAEARIKRNQIYPYLSELIRNKGNIPGGGADVNRIKNIFESMPDNLTLQQANEMKRGIYQELRDVGYKLDPKLTVKGAALKQIARGLKTEIESTVGGTVVSDINKKLSVYGKLENIIVDEMARSMRRNGVGLTDAILASGGIATLNPLGMLAGIGAAGLRHASGSTNARTTLAKGLNNLQSVGTGRTAGVIKGTLKRGALNFP